MTCSYLIILSQQLLLLKCVYLPSLLFPGRSNSLSRRLLVHCLCPATIAVSEWRHHRRKALSISSRRHHHFHANCIVKQFHLQLPNAMSILVLLQHSMRLRFFFCCVCPLFLQDSVVPCSLISPWHKCGISNGNTTLPATLHMQEERPKRHGLNQRSRNCISSTSTSSSYSLLLSPSELCRVVFGSCQG